MEKNMQKNLIVGLVIALIGVVFALQNAEPITIKLLFWKLEASLALVILVTIILGTIASIAVALPEAYRKNKQVKSLKEEIAKLEEKLGERVEVIEIQHQNTEIKEQEMPQEEQSEKIEEEMRDSSR